MLTRQEFLASLLGGLGLATLAACKSDSAKPTVDAPVTPADAPKQSDAAVTGDGPPADAPPATCTDTTEAISANHGHAVDVTIADVTAGVEKTYDITGASGHSHSITITAPMFAMLKLAGDKISVTSTVGAAHTHVVTVTCVG